MAGNWVFVMLRKENRKERGKWKCGLIYTQYQRTIALIRAEMLPSSYFSDFI